MNKFREARQQIEKNNRVVERYEKMVQDAEVYLAEHLRPLDGLIQRQIGVIDWYRERYPERKMCDEEILNHIEELERKHGSED